MTKIVFIAALVLGTMAQAGIKSVDYFEKVKFDKMSAAEAFSTQKYEKQYAHVLFPGTATYVNTTFGVCVDGKTVKTIKPVGYCVAYSATKKGETKTFSSKADADNYGGNVTCSKQVYKDLSSPLNYTATECAVWAVDTKMAGPAKTFTYWGSAKDYADNNDDAESNAAPYCVKQVQVAKTISTVYSIKYFFEGAELGSKKYSMRSCRDM